MKEDEITISEIDRLAELSALSFTEEEKKSLIGEVSNIIKMLNECGKVETSSMKYDNTHTLEELREDIVGESLSNEEALMNAPRQRKGYYNVPKVVE